jgi:hypothetical protein
MVPDKGYGLFFAPPFCRLPFLTLLLRLPDALPPECESEDDEPLRLVNRFIHVENGLRRLCRSKQTARIVS